jgi:hypothetical protein
LPPYAEAVITHMANAPKSSYDLGHDSNILENTITPKYLDFEAIKSDTSISCDEL